MGHSKSPVGQLFDTSTINYSKFDTLATLYNNSASLVDTKDYYTDRQESYTNLLVSQLNSSSNLDNVAVSKFLDFNFGLNYQISERNNPYFFNNNFSSVPSTQLHQLNS